ncbi:hypothetical protein Halha_2597 [Halobacteroides halobius DSM 5150]|uniref:Cyclic lactone autoinducer peptide n=1 Tax=Halobacteroides halobius (strain ATCC 35273 / DSM 5150 / MD-1) TaxID=748449 RepID=L0KD44_HALHC|nr:cyclic lactone autoinducer peptide [Halobacteroides halobius]AGB42470.1 hypothetical protein Halha_2597 [Halobacteroides halobius DSM 5150]
MKAKQAVKKIIKIVAKANVSSTSITLSYQPEVPKALKEKE